MKKHILLLGISGIIAALIVIQACHKPKTNDLSYVKHAAKRVSFSGALPTVDGGTLTFKDGNQYLAYKDFLAAAVNDDPDSIGEDGILDSIEMSLGYRSLRADALDKFEAQNATGWAQDADIPQEDWISSRIIRSMLDVNREVKIGTHIMKYLSTEYVAEVVADQTGMLASLRQLGSDPKIEDILALDPTREYISVSSMSNLEKVFGTSEFADGLGTYGTPVPLGDYQISGTVYNDFTCSNPGYVNFQGFQITRFGVPQKAKYRIELNDPSNTVYDYNQNISSMGPGQSILATVVGNYPEGTWHPTVYAISISPTSSGSTVAAWQTYTVTVKGRGATCVTGAHGAFTQHQIDNNNVIWGKIDYSTFHSWLTGNETTISGYTELHVQDNSGHWNRRKDKKTHLCVTVKADLTNDQCLNVTNKSTGQQCDRNTNQKSASSTYSGYSSLQKLVGIHEVAVENGVSGSFQQTIQICP